MAISNKHSGWSDRGYLPHYDKPGLVQAVTFRLADSLPKEKRAEWQHLLEITDDGPLHRAQPRESESGETCHRLAVVQRHAKSEGLTKTRTV